MRQNNARHDLVLIACELRLKDQRYCLASRLKLLETNVDLQLRCCLMLRLSFARTRIRCTAVVHCVTLDVFSESLCSPVSVRKTALLSYTRELTRLKRVNTKYGKLFFCKLSMSHPRFLFILFAVRQRAVHNPNLKNEYGSCPVSAARSAKANNNISLFVMFVGVLAGQERRAGHAWQERR